MRRHVVVASVLALLAACETGERPPPSYDLAAVTPPTAPTVQPPTPQSDRDCLAEAVYFEGRGEGREGQLAIAHVVLNRAAAKGNPKGVCDVIREGEELGKGKCQFSWRCDGKPDQPTESAAWGEAQQVADSVLKGGTTDPTHGALFFHHTKVQPDWTTKLRRTAEIGSHIYYAK